MTASNAQHEPIPAGAEVATVLQAARLLGISTRQVNAEIRRGRIPATKAGGRVVISRAVIDALRGRQLSKRL